MWVTAANHCGVHEGFADWRSLTTDRNGTASFVAPAYPLYVEAAYYKKTLTHGRTVLQLQHGERLDAGTDHVLQGVWDAPADRTFRLHVVRPDGRPAQATLLRDTDACMSLGIPVGSTDANGDIVARFAPEVVGSLTLLEDYRDYEQGDELTEEEVGRLFESGTLSVVWPRAK